MLTFKGLRWKTGLPIPNAHLNHNIEANNLPKAQATDMLLPLT